jgi:hypothetical protein
VLALAQTGIEPQRTWVAEGMLAAMTDEIRWVEANRALFTH